MYSMRKNLCPKLEKSLSKPSFSKNRPSPPNRYGSLKKRTTKITKYNNIKEEEKKKHGLIKISRL